MSKHKNHNIADIMQHTSHQTWQIYHTNKQKGIKYLRYISITFVLLEKSELI